MSIKISNNHYSSFMNYICYFNIFIYSPNFKIYLVYIINQLVVLIMKKIPDFWHSIGINRNKFAERKFLPLIENSILGLSTMLFIFFYRSHIDLLEFFFY